MRTFLRQERSVATQQVARFTGEGAYHGSTRARPTAGPAAALAPVVEEMRPRSLERYDAAGVREIASFTARFPNRHEVLARLPVPDQEAIRADGVRGFFEATTSNGAIDARVLEASGTRPSTISAVV